MVSIIKDLNHGGHVLDELDLNTRYWHCPSCHSVNDRDGNASKNIKVDDASAADLGDDVRRSRIAVAA